MDFGGRAGHHLGQVLQQRLIVDTGWIEHRRQPCRRQVSHARDRPFPDAGPLHRGEPDGAPLFARTRPRTRSGSIRAISIATRPPSECPKTTPVPYHRFEDGIRHVCDQGDVGIDDVAKVTQHRLKAPPDPVVGYKAGCKCVKTQPSLMLIRWEVAGQLSLLPLQRRETQAAAAGVYLARICLQNGAIIDIFVYKSGMRFEKWRSSQDALNTRRGSALRSDSERRLCAARAAVRDHARGTPAGRRCGRRRPAARRGPARTSGHRPAKRCRILSTPLNCAVYSNSPQAARVAAARSPRRKSPKESELDEAVFSADHRRTSALRPPEPRLSHFSLDDFRQASWSGRLIGPIACLWPRPQPSSAGRN